MKRRTRAIGKASQISTIILMALSLTPAMVGLGRAEEKSAFQDVPVAVLCAGQDKLIVGYLAELRNDGSAVYTALTGQQVGVLSSNGDLSRVGETGVPAGQGCEGMTLKDLREEGRTIEFPE